MVINEQTPPRCAVFCVLVFWRMKASDKAASPAGGMRFTLSTAEVRRVLYVSAALFPLSLHRSAVLHA